MKKILFIFIWIVSFSLHAQVPLFKALVYDSSIVKGCFFIVSKEHLMILDKNGDAVYYKYIPHGDNSDFKIQPNKEMSYFNGGEYRLMDSSFKVVDHVACKNDETDFHELMMLPNGHFLLMGREKIIMNLSRYQCKGHQGKDTSTVMGGVIQELDAGRNVVFEWHAKDHFAFEEVDTFRYCFGDDPWWTHWNSLDMDRDGNILLSSRNFNEITKIDHKDGSIIWRLGGKKNQFKIINSPIPFYGQRNIQVLDNGDITFLDGGYAAKSHGARAMEFKLDERKKTATLKWSYTYDSSYTTIAWGNVQRLAHSNTLIDFGGLKDTFTISFVIVDSTGKKLYQVNGPRAFRAYYYETIPFQLHRPEIICFDSLGITYLKTTKSYPAYLWNDSSTNRTISVIKSGVYFVFVPYGEGGFISSQRVVVTEIEHPCILKSTYYRNKN